MNYHKRTLISTVIADMQATRSKLKKVEILQAAKEAQIPFLPEVLAAAYDDFKQYGIVQVGEYNTTSDSEGWNDGWKHFLQFLTALEKREVTGAKAKTRLIQQINNMALSEREVAVSVLKKDMRMGATASTINKVWPHLIAVFNVSLCDRPDLKTIKRIKFPAYAQEKIDALRCCPVVKSGEVTYKSRSGKVMFLHGTLDKDVLAICNADMVLDGELKFLNEAGDAFLPRKESNGLANKAIRGTLSEEDAKRAVIDVWDALPFNDFAANECLIPYSKRLAWLEKRIKVTAAQRVVLVDNRVVNSLYEAKRFFEEVVDMGGEGIVLKNTESTWVGKRLPDWLKFKLVRESDLKVIGVEEGKAGKKFEGKLGGLVCSTSDGKIVVTVGGGYSEAQRTEYFTEDMIGKIVAVEFNEIINSSDPTTPERLFLPQFVEVRKDKFVADDYATLASEKGMKIWDMIIGKR